MRTSLVELRDAAANLRASSVGSLPAPPARSARSLDSASPRARALVLGAASAALVLGVAAPALAVEPEVTADTAAQFYEVTSPDGQRVLTRRRFTATLGVAGTDLLNKDKLRAQDPLAPELLFRARVRFDSDYGAGGEEANRQSPETLVPGFNRGPIDLMYAYVEGRRFFKGVAGFKLGRQYVTDVLGWWSFDGATVRATTPFFVAVEAYGGLEQRGGMPLSTPRFERDGIMRGSRTNFDPAAWTSFQPARVAPAFGAALESTGTSFVHTRVTYRRVYNTGASNVSMYDDGLRSPVQYDGTRVSSERIGYAFDGSLPDVGGVKGGLVYDLYVKKFSQLYLSTDVYATQKLTLSADFDHFRPTFDGDSIWNFFVSGPTNDIGGRLAYQANDHLGISGGGHVRLFNNQTESATDDTTEPRLGAPTSPNGLASGNYYPEGAFYVNGGGNVAAKYRYTRGNVSLRGAADGGGTGGRAGGDVYADHTFQNRYLVSARAGAWYWKDSLRPDRSATSFGYVLGAGYILSPRSQAMVEFEHDVNRVVGNRFRLMLWLTLAVTK